MAERVRTPLRETSAWRRLEWHRADVRHAELRDLFEGDPTRGERLAAEAAGLYLDYSKHLLTDETLELLRKLAAERRLRERASALARGDAADDPQAVRHVALRVPRSRSVFVDGVDVVREAHEALDRMYEIADHVRSGSWVGATGKRIRAVVEVGTAGPQLACALAYEALCARHEHELVCRFVSNLDPAALAAALEGLDPEETLLVVVARDLDEPAPLVNAEAARAWLGASLGEGALERHLLVATARVERASTLGVGPESVLRLPPWLDDARSLPSAAGFSVCLALGPEGFRELVDGFHALDEHFGKTPLGGNLPAIAGLIAVWYRYFAGVETSAVVPYGEQLRLLPTVVRNLAAGAAGTGVREVETAPLVWGGAGTSAQDTFLRLLHRGGLLCPVDFVAAARSGVEGRERHDLLAANALAQAEALAFGQGGEELEDAGLALEGPPDGMLPGNRPSSVLLTGSLTPATLGALLAFYEHSVFTQAAIGEVDVFAPNRVAHAEELAARIAPELDPGWKRELMHDSSTNALVRRYRRFRDDRA